MQLFRRLTTSRIASSSVKDRQYILSNHVQPNVRLRVALLIAIIGLLGFLIILMTSVSGG